MTGLGIHAWLLSLIGIRPAFTYQEIAAMLEVIHNFGNAYRLASSGVGSGVVCGRFALGFCSAVVACATAKLVWLARVQTGGW